MSRRKKDFPQDEKDLIESGWKMKPDQEGGIIWEKEGKLYSLKDALEEEEMLKAIQALADPYT
jgi:hypothetical protein